MSDHYPPRIQLPGQAPPPDTRNPVSVNSDPTTGLTVVKHINGNEVVFAPDGTFGLRGGDGKSYIQLNKNGIIEISAKQIVMLSDGPVKHIVRNAEGEGLHRVSDLDETKHSVVGNKKPEEPPSEQRDLA